MANVFLQYNQEAMINKFSLNYNTDWLYLSFINRAYRINRKSGTIQWSNDNFKTVCEADYNELMTIYDVLCYSKDNCQPAHQFVNINSLSTVRTGNLSQENGFFQTTADSFNGKLTELRNACLSLSGKEMLKKNIQNNNKRKHIPKGTQGRNPPKLRFHIRGTDDTGTDQKRHHPQPHHDIPHQPPQKPRQVI